MKGQEPIEQVQSPSEVMPATLSRLRVRWYWIVVPALMWLVIDLAVGKFFAKNLRWYEAGEADLKVRPAQAIFVGSSRVNAAIDTDEIDKLLTAKNGRPFHSLNMGFGYSTTNMHYLGLRDMFEKFPDKLQDATVFIETTGGIPEYRLRDEAWAAAYPGMMLPFLKRSDLPGLWHTNDSFENKTQITLRYAFRWSNIFSRKDKVQQYAIMANDTKIAPKLARVPKPAASSDLTAEGGIRQDAEGVAEVRRMAYSAVANSLKSEKVLDHWEDTAIADIVAMVKSHGGHIVFFDVPMSAVMDRPNQTAIAKRNAEIFAKQAAQWDCASLKVKFSTMDDDFPDLWHMRRSAAPAFSRTVVEAWLRTLSAEAVPSPKH